MYCKCRSHIVIGYVKESKNWPTEECFEFSYAFKIVDFLTGRELKSNSVVCYSLANFLLDPVSLL